MVRHFDSCFGIVIAAVEICKRKLDVKHLAETERGG